jgi:hypothetical protein
MARSIFMGKSSEKLSTISLTDNTVTQRTAKHLEAMFINPLETAIEFAIQQD